MSWFNSMVPRACLFIDSTMKATLEGFELVAYSTESPLDRQLAEEDLERLWKRDTDHFYILPCLSVRSGLDLYLTVKAFPPGSEIIMSAINIPTMVQVVHHHGLRIRTCDMDLETMEPSPEQMKSLINDRTVAVLVAHLYGKRCDMAPVIKICKQRSIAILEDCAEAFSGLDFVGHPDSDISFFSFGVIKPATAFGGAILRINNTDLYKAMVKLHDTYPIQTRYQYLKKLVKYSALTVCFNSSTLFRCGVPAFRLAGVDHKDVFVPFLRGFPSNLINQIRRRPSIVLLNNLTFRLTSFSELDNKCVLEKGNYVTERLPHAAIAVGKNALYVSYWLYPILVENPEKVVKHLNQLGVDASTGSTQLDIVKDDLFEERQEQLSSTDDVGPTPCGRFLMKHVVYLPVHKLVPYDELDKIIIALKTSLTELGCRRLSLPSKPQQLLSTPV